MAKGKPFTILVATDGSEEATAAVNAVAVFPWPADARVEGVVVRTTVTTTEIPEYVWADVEKGQAALAEAARKSLARRWPDAKVRVVDGPIVEAIVARADRLGANVIVLGSRGHGAIARLLLGSTSLGVIRHTKRPTLVVRGRARAYTRVVVGMDGSRHARRAVTFIAGLAVPPGGQVTLVRVMERAKLPTLLLLPDSARAAIDAQNAKVDAAESRKATREMEAAAAELRRTGWKVDIVVREGAPLDELLATIKSARAQLLAVGARGHGALEVLLLGSVAEGAVHRAEVPVLVVR
jgi:nucleotide-binding universal stress UspA family protein